MAIEQARKEKLGGRKKKKADMGSDPKYCHSLHGKDGKEKNTKTKTRGGTEKTSLIAAASVNLSVKGKTKRVVIKAVDENPANRDFKRMGILSKGAIIETEEGKAKISSRPSQDGVINAVLLE